MRYRHTKSAKFIRATFAVPDKQPRRLPDISLQDSTFDRGCAKFTLASGRVFHGTKLKCATRSWQRDGQTNTPTRLRPEESHFRNLSLVWVERLPTCWMKRRNHRSRWLHTPVSFASCLRSGAMCPSKKLGIGQRTMDLSWHLPQIVLTKLRLGTRFGLSQLFEQVGIGTEDFAIYSAGRA